MALLGGTLTQLAKDRGIDVNELTKLNPNLRTDTTYSVGEVKFSSPSVPSGVSYDPKTNISTTAPKTDSSQGYTRDSQGNVFDSSGNHVTYESLPKGPDGKPLMNLETLPLKSPVADTNPEEEVISDTSEQRNKIKTQNQKIQDQFAQFGVKPPEDTTSPVVEEVLKGLKTRQEELDRRQAEDIATTEKGFETAKSELQMSQQEAFERASGRTRIGGFIVREEIQDLERMQRQFRLELAGLEGQKQTAIQQAQRFYNDQNYKLAQTQLELAQNLEEQTYQRKNDYFNNILKFQQMQKPVIDLDEVSQNYALKQMSQYPSGFTDLEPEDFQHISLSEINKRVLGSNEYKMELRGEKADILRKEDLADGGGTITTNYSKALQQGIADLYSGDYGTTGAREKLLTKLQSLFPNQKELFNIDKTNPIYSRIPDGYEKNIVPKQSASTNKASRLQELLIKSDNGQNLDALSQQEQAELYSLL